MLLFSPEEEGGLPLTVHDVDGDDEDWSSLQRFLFGLSLMCMWNLHFANYTARIKIISFKHSQLQLVSMNVLVTGGSHHSSLVCHESTFFLQHFLCNDVITTWNPIHQQLLSLYFSDIQNFWWSHAASKQNFLLCLSSVMLRYIKTLKIWQGCYCSRKLSPMESRFLKWF